MTDESLRLIQEVHAAALRGLTQMLNDRIKLATLDGVDVHVHVEPEIDPNREFSRAGWSKVKLFTVRCTAILGEGPPREVV
jgi:hypothetical protein